MCGHAEVNRKKEESGEISFLEETKENYKVERYTKCSTPAKKNC